MDGGGQVGWLVSAAPLDVIHLRRHADPPFGDHAVGVGSEHQDLPATVLLDPQAVAAGMRLTFAVAAVLIFMAVAIAGLQRILAQRTGSGKGVKGLTSAR